MHLILPRDCRTGGLLAESMAEESEDVQPKRSSWPLEEHVNARSGNCEQLSVVHASSGRFCPLLAFAAVESAGHRRLTDRICGHDFTSAFTVAPGSRLDCACHTSI